MITKIKNKFKQLLNNEYQRIEWVKSELLKLKSGSKILDAGCGSQQYKKYCNHLEYFAQDFGKYNTDEVDSFAASNVPYQYGILNYTGDIWEIDEVDNKFDAILCTSVLEHIPYPERTLKEFYRLLKPEGKLILTFPSNCLRHMDPYFFSSGYSDRYMEYFLPKIGYQIEYIMPVGDYYKWLLVEIYRTMRENGIFSSIMLFPSFVYYYLKQKHPSSRSISTLCQGYHIVAKKQNI